MADDYDVASIVQGADKRALEVLVDSQRALEERIDQPFEHYGKKSKEERQAEARLWASQPELVAAMHREDITRTGVQPHESEPTFYGPRLKMLVQWFKELQEAENATTPSR